MSGMGRSVRSGEAGLGGEGKIASPWLWATGPSWVWGSPFQVTIILWFQGGQDVSYWGQKQGGGPCHPGL